MLNYITTTKMLSVSIIDVLIIFQNESFHQYHGNVNLKSIFKVGHTYKLAEPSLSETNSDYLRYIG